MKGILWFFKQPYLMPTTLRVEVLGGELPAGRQGQQNTGRKERRTHLERAEEKPLLGRRGCFPE